MSEWPFVARSEEFRVALDALHTPSEHSGVVLRGEGGVGKTTLAHQLAESLIADGWTKRAVLGTKTGHAVPLGAFNPLVFIDHARDPAVMLAVAYRELAATEKTVLVVDDAQYLDPLSALLVSQLAMGGRQRLIVTCRSGEPVHDAVAALWKEQLLLRIDLEPFSRSETAELVASVVGGEVDDVAIDRLHRLSSGSPLILRGLVTAALADGALARRDGRWVINAEFHFDPDLTEVVESQLLTLSPAQREVVEIVATAEVLDWRILRELCDSEDIAGAERVGAVQVVGDGSQTLVQIANPILGEVIRQQCGLARTRVLNTMLAKSLSKHLGDVREKTGAEGTDVRTTIQLAQFTMRGDAPADLDLVVSAAASAVTMANLTLGEELARFAWDRGGSIDAAIVLADALAWQGRGPEAEAILGALDPDGSDVWATLRWGGVRAANLFFGCGRPDAARDVLATVRRRVPPGQDMYAMAAIEASFAFFGRDLQTAVAVGLDALRSEILPTAAVWAALATSGALALSGRFAEVPEIAEIGSRAADLCESGPQRYALGFTEIFGLTGSGDLAGAERVCRRYTTMTSGVPQAEAIVNALNGRVQLARGALTPACDQLQRSLWAMSGSLPPTWVMLVAAWFAQAEGARGNAAAAAQGLAKAEEANGPHVAVFEPDLALARAWVCAASGETTTARDHAVSAARIARTAGMLTMEIAALHCAIRLGDRSQATRLGQLTRLAPSPMTSAVSAHARGLADRDGDRLDDAARRFEGFGAMAMAADAYAHAAREHARAGARAKEFASSARAHELAGHGDVHTPALGAADTPLPITDREREIATLVGEGLTNRQVADRLGVSVRTIDGHLYRIFGKLGIDDRDQLALLIRAAAKGSGIQRRPLR